MVMGQGRVDRRRGRRASVQAPLLIRRIGTRDVKSVQEKLATNISLAGVYFETEEKTPYALNEIVLASVSVPESQTREFPFTRWAGRARVVRVDEKSEQGTGGRKRLGVALEFGEDLTALTAIPSRS